MAADVYGVQATKAFNTSPSEKMPVPYVGGGVRVDHDTYEAVALADGGYIQMGGILEKGTLIEPISRIDHDALGSSTDIAVYLRPLSGGADVALIADQDTSAAGDILFTAITFPYEVLEDSYLVLEVENAAITGTIKSNIYYTPLA